MADFQVSGGAHDVIDVHAFFHDLTSLKASASQVGNGILIAFDPHDSVLLSGVTLNSLQANDFIFG